MAQRFYDISLDTPIFPMLSEKQGRTIIGSTAGEAPAREDKPGVAYCHNVMPSKEGFDSVGYLSIIQATAFLPAGLEFSDVRIAYGDATSRIHLAWDTEGNVYALLLGSTEWRSLPLTVPATTGPGFSIESVTIGTVNGVSHIFYSGIGSFTYNETTNQLDAETLAGLSISDVLGVMASSGYLVAYTNIAIAWSSTIEPTDFVPSEVTGAGGGNVADLAGAILFGTTNTLGLLLYTSANTVAGTYTGNAKFPFKFREVKNSRGGISLDQIAYQSNADEQFVYSKAGLQSITSQRAEIILPEVTDFLAGKRFEDFDDTTLLYTRTDLTSVMQKKIKYIASRYLVISYGISSFTHALVFDIGLKKLGKLKFTHVDAFEYVGDQTEIAKESIALVSATGEVSVVDFSAQAESSGILILGKLQFVRSRLITLLGADVENVDTSATMELHTQASLKGKSADRTVKGGVISSTENLRQFSFRETALNHSLIFKGKYNLTTAQIVYTIAGRR